MPKVNPIPEGYHTVTPYLVVQDAEAVLDFTVRALGATERMRMPGAGGKISHAEVTIGDSIVMLGSPAPGVRPTDATNNRLMPAMLYLYVDDADATYKRAISAGAKSIEEPNDAFYGDRRAGVEDSQGNVWFVATHQEDPTGEQLQARMAAMQGARAN